MQTLLRRLFGKGGHGRVGTRCSSCLILGMGFLLFVVGNAWGSASLTVDVERLIDEANRTSLIPVIVKFRDQVDITTLRSQISQQMQYAVRSEASRKRQQKLLRREIVTGLKARAEDSRRTLATLLHRYGVETDLKSLWSINAVALKLPAHLVDEVASLPGIERISVDMQLTMNAVTPELVTTQPQWNLSDINAEYVWQQGYAGDGVVVAIMDSGVELNHPDLVVILGGDASGYQIGLAPHAQWIAARLFDNEDQASLSAIHQAFQWILDPDGDPTTNDAPDVVNNSWGFSSTINQCYQEFSDDIRLLREAGIAVVFSAGNYGPSAETSISPANDPGVVSVGSVDQFSDIDTFSSRGPGACDGGIFPKLVAPGSLIFVADRLPVTYNVVTGTSFSAPHVTGAIALLKSAFPMATVSQIETALYDSATDLGATGGDDLYGYGMLNVASAFDLLFRDLGSNSAGMLIFSESLYSVDETTDKLVVTVRRLGGSAGEVTVDYETLPGQASDAQPADFVGTSGTLRFADGETLRSFEIDIIDDNLDEKNETFYINLSNPTGDAQLSNQPQVAVTILDDDGPGAISFGAVNYAVNESKDYASVTLLRTGGSEGAVSVDLTLVDDTAIVDSDYLLPANGAVRFLDGEISREVTVPLVDDGVYEGNETFSILLSNASGGAQVEQPASTTVTILDDDPDTSITTLHMEAVNYLVSESRGEVTVTVLRSGNIDRTATVNYETVAGSATPDDDYVTRKGSLTFRPKVTSKQISIPIKDDGIYEKESSFTLVLTGVDSGSVLAKPAAAIIRISNDDAQPYVALGSNGSSSGYSSGLNSSDSLVGGGGLGDGKDSNTEEEKNARGNSRGELKIFDLNLRGYSVEGGDALRRLQTLDGNLPDVSKPENDGKTNSDNACQGDDKSAPEGCKAEGKSRNRAGEQLSKAIKSEPAAESNPSASAPPGEVKK
ncbi:MAG: Calx-beta domain-containing protein [Candidatus Thiodiazotropha sp.]